MRKRVTGANVALQSVYPAWAGWLCLLIGPGYTVPLYYHYFRPVKNAGGWRFFTAPDDPGLWLAAALTTVLFSGVGAAILSSRQQWKRKHWNGSLREVHPNEPWRWREEWDGRRVLAESSTGQWYVILWSLLCLMAAFPNVEFWQHRGAGWPDHQLSWAGICSAAVGILAISLACRSLIRRHFQPKAILHLAAETGTIGGPLEGGIEMAGAVGEKIVARLVCERHSIVRRKTSDGTTTEHKVDIAYEDTHQSELRNKFFPIRFAIPFSQNETSRDSITPVYLWFVELLNTDGEQLGRFQVPVFKTDNSREDFELSGATADSSIDEERPEEILGRYGISVLADERQSDAVTEIVVPPLRAGGLAFGLLIFGLIFSGVAVGMFLLINELFRYVFVVVFGFFGVLLTGCAVPMLFEHRKVSFDAHALRIRRSYFGCGWTRTLLWDDVNSIDIRFSGSSGSRVKYKTVVASTDGMARRDGSMMDRRHAIISTVPSEAAEAAKWLLESAATGEP